MSKTIAEKILSAKSGKDVHAGEIVEAKVDYVMVNDITGPAAFDEFEGLCAPIIRKKVVLIPDHYIPNKDLASAKQAKKMRDFARKHQVKNYFEVGSGGVCHQLMIEQGFVAPGRLIVGADSQRSSLVQSAGINEIHHRREAGQARIRKRRHIDNHRGHRR